MALLNYFTLVWRSLIVQSTVICPSSEKKGAEKKGAVTRWKVHVFFWYSLKLLNLCRRNKQRRQNHAERRSERIAVSGPRELVNRKLTTPKPVQRAFNLEELYFNSGLKRCQDLENGPPYPWEGELSICLSQNWIPFTLICLIEIKLAFKVGQDTCTKHVRTLRLPYLQCKGISYWCLTVLIILCCNQWLTIDVEEVCLSLV